VAGNEQLYYIQDSRQMVGNCILWWCPDSKGYTTQIDEAGLYTKKEVEGMRSTDVGWPKEFVDAHVSKHVRRDRLRQADTVETVRGR